MNNGRIIFDDQNINKKFELMDKIPVSTNTNFNNSLTGIFERSQLSDAYFSNVNIKTIQKKLKEGVYLKSKNKLIIDDQPDDIIITVMRAYFLQYSKNLDYDIHGQVFDLNNMVLNYLINSAYNEAISYLKYKKDATNMYTLMDMPKCSDKTNKTLEYKPWF